MTLARPGISLFGFLWLVVGVAMAAAYDYFDNVENVENGKRIASALLAVLLWPLLLIGIDLHVDP